MNVCVGVDACILEDSRRFWNILDHSACILEHSGTFWNILHAFWNILHAFWNILDVVEGCRKVDFQVDHTQTDIH